MTFLEETFSSQAANPKFRLHQKAARAVLNALLPDSGTDIKGQMKSYDELLEASGYAARPQDFGTWLPGFSAYGEPVGVEFCREWVGEAGC